MQGPGEVPLLDWAINIGLALIGGLVRFVREVRANLGQWSKKRIAFEGFAGLLTAGFSGALTFLVLKAWGVDHLYAAFASGMMGHAGPEGISLMWEGLSNAIRARTQQPPQK